MCCSVSTNINEGFNSHSKHSESNSQVSVHSITLNGCNSRGTYLRGTYFFEQCDSHPIKHMVRLYSA